MVAPRLTTAMLVSALLRRVNADGGMGAVLARGDAGAGALLIQLAARGVDGPLMERVLGPDGCYRWVSTGPADPGARVEYLARRRRNDPDLWLVELDHSNADALLRAVTDG